MENFSQNQIRAMEQEATRRARELNKKSKPQTLPSSQTTAQNNPQKNKGIFSFLNALDLKKLIGENSEQAMLLLLILVLANENTCDEFLLYALIYIML